MMKKLNEMLNANNCGSLIHSIHRAISERAFVGFVKTHSEKVSSTVSKVRSSNVSDSTSICASATSGRTELSLLLLGLPPIVPKPPAAMRERLC